MINYKAFIYLLEYIIISFKTVSTKHEDWMGLMTSPNIFVGDDI